MSPVCLLSRRARALVTFRALSLCESGPLAPSSNCIDCLHAVRYRARRYRAPASTTTKHTDDPQQQHVAHCSNDIRLCHSPGDIDVIENPSSPRDHHQVRIFMSFFM